MKELFSNWPGLKKELSGKFIVLFLDYDGTLTPIVRTPHQALLPKATKQLMGKLSKKRGCRIAVISGRTLKDVKKKVGLKGIIYSGNHGLEIEGPGINFKSKSFLSLRYKATIKKIKNNLSKRSSGIKGAFVEDKELTLSLHFRRVAKNKLSLLEKIFHQITRPLIKKKKIRVRPGKKVFEIRPPIQWDKGKVVRWLLKRGEFSSKQAVPIYIGDDVTDEDAFRALSSKGITIFVGKKRKTLANYHLKDTRAVVEFLRRILEL